MSERSKKLNREIRQIREGGGAGIGGLAAGREGRRDESAVAALWRDESTVAAPGRDRRTGYAQASPRRVIRVNLG
jgi:hypothetical protein